MGTSRVYIKPFNADGSYSSAFVDVSNYVESVGTISEDIDSLDFQLGVFRNSSVEIDLNNRDGQFSDVGEATSMFKYTRANSIVQIRWMEGAGAPIAGFMEVGMPLSPEVVLYEGLLNDESLVEDAGTESVAFQVLGYTTLFQNCTVPFSSLAAGQTHQQAIYTILNQPQITKYLTVSLANIQPYTNLPLDSVASLQNSDVQSALDKILLTSNSVLYVRNGAIYVSSRAATADTKGIYYGQASQLGSENISTVGNKKTGIARTFNYFYWKDTNVTQVSLTSVAKNFQRIHEIDVDLFTDLGKQNTMLFNLLQEFKDPKAEFEMTVPLGYKEIALQLLDQIRIDYPTIFVASEGFTLPICGVAICGSSDPGVRGAVLPRGLWSLTIDVNTGFKILTRTFDPTAETAMFKVRRI